MHEHNCQCGRGPPQVSPGLFPTYQVHQLIFIVQVSLELLTVDLCMD